VEECVEAMAEAGCNALQAMLGEDELQLFEITDRCELGELLQPKSGLGQPCAETSDCISGFCPGLLATSCHRCTPFAARKEACNPGFVECDPKSATCAEAPGTGRICVPLAAVPAARRAKTGAACVDEPGACAESEARCVAGKCLVRPFILRDSASQTVKADDVLTIALDRRVRVLKVVQPGARRGGPADAKLLYQDLSPPPSPVPEPAAQAVRPQGAGRPSKRDHRRLLALKFGARDDFSSGEE
jgi:ribosome-associated heat shock protein Hsp15